MSWDSGIRFSGGSWPGSAVETRVCTMSGCRDRVRPPVKVKDRIRVLLLRLRLLITVASSS
ncbi:hypothetical protein GCM10009605_57200 [Nocardiopsis composta]